MTNTLAGRAPTVVASAGRAHTSACCGSPAWRRAAPFEQLSPSARADYLREYGMYGSASEHRVGTDAFELRHDVELGDACETAAQILRALIGSLEVLVVAPDGSRPHSDAIAGCAFLARQAAGALAVIAAGVFPGAST